MQDDLSRGDNLRSLRPAGSTAFTDGGNPWRLSDRFDPAALPLADAHYNRQKVGSPQFVPPGRCVVLLADRALWVTSWPFAEYVKHAWAGAWVNSCFRREAGPLASDLIAFAVAVTRAIWEPPPLGIVSFIDETKIRSVNPGYCYKQAGFHRARCPKHTTHEPKCSACLGRTEAGLLALQMFPHEMPAPDYSVTQPLLVGPAPPEGA